MKSIILGVFYTQYFRTIQENTNSSEFPFLSNDVLSEEEYFNAFGVIPNVELAAYRCDVINFLLDNIKLPLSRKSITCVELEYILKYPEILIKTTFWLGGNIIPRGRVVEVYNSVKDQTLSFNDIKF